MMSNQTFEGSMSNVQGGTIPSFGCTLEHQVVVGTTHDEHKTLHVDDGDEYSDYSFRLDEFSAWYTVMKIYVYTCI